MEDLTLEEGNENNENIDDEEEEKNKSHDDEDKDENENENKIIEKEEEKEEDPIEKEKTKLRLLLKSSNDDMAEKNYKNAEEKFRLLYEAKDKNEVKEIIIEQMSDILYNYSLCLYYQMKYEEATKYLYEIIINYDNKNKKAYLLLAQILYDINEYNRAKLLIAKVYKIFNNENDLNEFKEIDKDADSCIKRNNNNIKRQFYYNAEKEIVNFRKSLEFFYWCFYSICALVAGHYLSKLL